MHAPTYARTHTHIHTCYCFPEFKINRMLYTRVVTRMRSHNIKERNSRTALFLQYSYAVKDEWDDKNIPRILSIPIYIRDMLLLRTFYIRN